MESNRSILESAEIAERQLDAELAQMQLDIISGAPAAGPVLLIKNLETNQIITYDIMNREARKSLTEELYAIIEAVFTAMPVEYRRIHAHRAELKESIRLLSKPGYQTLLLRRKKIQRTLDNFLPLMSHLADYSQGGSFLLIDEVFTSWELKRYISRLNRLTNVGVTAKEHPKVARLVHYYENEEEVDDRSKEYRNISMWDFHFSLECGLMTSKLRELIQNHSSSTALSDHVKPRETKQSNREAETKKKVEAWLAELSSDLLAAYKDVETTLAEVSPLISSPEDEYFIEQIHKEYFPHIFTALKNFDVQSIDFHDKETVVSESIKQFKIIQLGLQKILDGVVAKRVKAVTSQTDFLRQKVLGENALSLTPSEADKAIEVSLAEAQRVREELYKQHVAPVLKKNLEECTDAIRKHTAAHNSELARRTDAFKSDLTQQKSTFNMELAQERVAHQKELGRQELTFREKLYQEKLEAQRKLGEQRTAHRKELEARDKLISKQAATSTAFKQLENEVETLESYLISLQDYYDSKIVIDSDDRAAVVRKQQKDDGLDQAARILLGETQHRFHEMKKSKVHDPSKMPATQEQNEAWIQWNAVNEQLEKDDPETVLEAERSVRKQAPARPYVETTDDEEYADLQTSYWDMIDRWSGYHPDSSDDYDYDY